MINSIQWKQLVPNSHTYGMTAAWYRRGGACFMETITVKWQPDCNNNPNNDPEDEEEDDNHRRTRCQG